MHGRLDIIIKKLRFLLNRDLAYKKINGKFVSKSKIPLLKICNGKGIDVGCGSNKIINDVIGVDIFGKGETGKFGCEKGRTSKADIKASGDNLYMFKDNSLDYVISRDNLEHYIDFIKTLKEWNRVLKPGGKLGITMPNDDVIDVISLDKTHKHAFNPSSLKNALETVGFKVLERGITIKGWGFYMISEKAK
ncbi:MAG: class I SAM-dependent methyltransferase [Nanoarchaeota archaeon]|nr:class I SAM-dependent methyltransferase [Nanoarchaeota archaeon]MBU4086030.1 class I SAM-dependent methyltransferase [Nanoarchaeota archaeon]